MGKKSSRPVQQLTDQQLIDQQLIDKQLINAANAGDFEALTKYLDGGAKIDARNIYVSHVLWFCDELRKTFLRCGLGWVC